MRYYDELIETVKGRPHRGRVRGGAWSGGGESG